MSDTTCSSICEPQMRDPWTKILSFVRNPGAVRGCNKFTAMCWDHAVYLEGELPCPYVTSVPPKYGERDQNVVGEEGTEDDAKMASGPSEESTTVMMVRTNTDGSESGAASGGGGGGGLLIYSAPVLHASGEDAPKRKDDQDEDLTLLPGDRSFKITMRNIPEDSSSFESWGTTIFAPWTSSIVAIHISSCSQLAAISAGYISKMPHLKEVVIQDMPNLAIMRCKIIGGCPQLRRVVFRRLPMLVEMGEDLGMDCGHRRCVAADFGKPILDPGGKLSLIQMEQLPSLKKINRRYFYRNSGADKIQIADFPALKEIDGFFCYKNNGVKEIVLHNLPALTKIGRSCADDCCALVSVRLSNLPNLTEILADFICHSVSFTTLTLDTLPSLKEIGFGLMTQCEKLEVVSLGNLPSLTKVGRQCLSKCTSLRQVELKNLPALTEIGEGFLSGSTRKLTELVFCDLPKLEINLLGIDSLSSSCRIEGDCHDSVVRAVVKAGTMKE